MIPEDILLEQQENLLHLDLSGNGLKWLPPQTLQNKTKLKTLILAGNSFSALPDDINGLKALEYLDLCQNNFISISKMDFPNLKVIKISDNNLKEVEQKSWDFPKLSTFVYSVNEKSAGFPVINALKNSEVTLSTVYMDFTYEALMARGKQLWNTESLTFHYKYSEAKGIHFTDELNAMENLKFLEMNFFKHEFPSFHKFGDHKKVVERFEFIIQNNSILEYLSLKDWSGPMDSFNHLIYLKTLKLTDCYFSWGSRRGLIFHQNIEIIDISQTDFPYRQLSDVFNESSKLLKIRIVEGGLEDIHSDAFVEQKLLEELDLILNSIKNLPIGVFRTLKNLKILKLAYNQIEVIPELIFDNLNNLLELDLKANRLLSFDA